MRRLKLFYERMGFVKSAIYALAIAYMGWFYTLVWPLPGGPLFVLSLLGIGIGLGCVCYPLISWNYPLAHRLITIARWTLFLGLLAIFNVPIRLHPLGTWSLHVFIWTLLTASFWLVTYTPKFSFADMQNLLDSFEDGNFPVDDAPAATKSAAPSDEKNWYRRD